MENNTLPPAPTAAPNALNAIPTAAAPKQSQSNFQDNLGYEDKRIGWDGPVWCNRYGRFEHKAQAAAEDDDGNRSDSPVPPGNSENYRMHRCQRDGCGCRVPVAYQSYVQDIQRRIEPMTVSLVALEHQVGKLAHHIVKDGEQAVLDTFNHDGDGKERFATHSADGQEEADRRMHEHFHEHHVTMAETIANLEGRVHSLTHQLDVLVRQNDELIRDRQAGPVQHHYWQIPQQRNPGGLGGVGTH